MPITSKQMIRLLLEHGFEITGQNGSHVKLRDYRTNRQTIVPLHNKDLGKGLEQAILKQAGIKFS